MRQHTQVGWSLICSALVLLMVLGGVEPASAARRHRRHHSSFSRDAHPRPRLRHHRGHRHQRWQHSHFRRHHHTRSRVFFGFGVHSGYPFWPYYYDPYTYGPGYANPYSPGVSQRFPDFRLPASFAYLGDLARAGEGVQAATPEEQKNPSAQPFDLHIKPQPKPGG